MSGVRGSIQLAHWAMTNVVFNFFLHFIPPVSCLKKTKDGIETKVSQLVMETFKDSFLV
jgi:hypothetical protein